MHLISCIFFFSEFSRPMPQLFSIHTPPQHTHTHTHLTKEIRAHGRINKSFEMLTLKCVAGPQSFSFLFCTTDQKESERLTSTLSAACEDGRWSLVGFCNTKERKNDDDNDDEDDDEEEEEEEEEEKKKKKKERQEEKKEQEGGGKEQNNNNNNNNKQPTKQTKTQTIKQPLPKKQTNKQTKARNSCELKLVCWMLWPQFQLFDPQVFDRGSLWPHIKFLWGSRIRRRSIQRRYSRVLLFPPFVSWHPLSGISSTWTAIICLLYRDNESITDHIALQSDLKQLDTWAHDRGTKFNAKKCTSPSVTEKQDDFPLQPQQRIAGAFVSWKIWHGIHVSLPSQRESTASS